MTQALTPTIRIPPSQEHLEAVFQSHGYVQEDFIQEYARVRREALSKIDEELTESQAYFDVRQFLSTDEAKRKASQSLAENANSPIVSKETNIAILKSLISDFNRNKKRPGLNALTVLKAVELINRMCSYDSPVKHEIKAEHKVTCLPVIQAPFKGELPVLRVHDLSDEYGNNATVALGDKEDETVDPDF